MPLSSPDPQLLPERLRKAVERIYGLDGVVAVRIWHWGDRVAVGVRCASTITPAIVLERVEGVVASLREPGETWDFGLLEEGAGSGPAEGRS